MTIDKKNNKWRIRQMIDGKTYSVTVDHKPTKKEAEELLREKCNKPAAKSPHMTFSEAYTGYVTIKSNVLSPSTLRGYKNAFSSLPEYFKEIELQDIDQIVVQQLVNDYTKSHSPKTTRNMHGLISAVLGVYYPELVLRTTLPQKVAKEPYIPTDDEVKKIFEYVRGTEFEIPFALGALSCRRSEICAATIDDLEGNILHINKAFLQDDHNKWSIRPYTKTENSTRDILLPDHLADLIRKHGCLYKGHPNNLNKHLALVQEDLEIPAFTFHKLRHYFASYAHSIGMSDADIMKMGGWKSDNVMKTVYRHAMKVEESQKAAAEHIGSLFN